MQNTIAIVMDFDDTLAPNCISAMLETYGIHAGDFWEKQVQAFMDDGWDPVPSFMHTLKLISDSLPEKQRITRESLMQWGAKIRFFPGVTRLFPDLQQHMLSNWPELKLEFFLVSSGLGEILRHTRIARYFTEIWASDYYYARDGAIAGPRNVLSFTDKTRCLFQIAKGFYGPEYRNQCFAVNQKVAEPDLCVPFPRMIFLGDGFTDVPCFTVVRKHGGIAIGVYNPKGDLPWKRSWEFVVQGRVSTLAKADYSRNSCLRDTLFMALESIATGFPQESAVRP